MKYKADDRRLLHFTIGKAMCQVFFLYELLFVFLRLMLSLFISMLLPDRVLLSWFIFFRLSSQICHRIVTAIMIF